MLPSAIELQSENAQAKKTPPLNPRHANGMLAYQPKAGLGLQAVIYFRPERLW
jgi:hypothetical protein